MIVEQFPDRTITVDGEEFLYFGGTAYLGLPTHKKFQKIITDNIKIWGTAYGSSRNANVKLSAYDTAEKYLANHIQAEAAVTVTSGTLAGKLVIEQLAISGATFFHLPNHHNAIQTPSSIPVWLGAKLHPRLLDSNEEKIVILTDAVPTLTIQPIDLSFIKKINPKKEITLVIDESHSLGIIGKNGCGLFSQIKSKKIKHKIMISSLGKGMGITGGVIAGSKKFVDQIKSMGNFISAAGINPAFAISIAEAKKIHSKQLQKLAANMAYLDQHLNKTAVDFDVNYPIIYPKEKNIYEILKSKKIIITHFKYPNEAGSVSRIVVTANHIKKDLKKLISILNNNC